MLIFRVNSIVENYLLKTCVQTSVYIRIKMSLLGTLRANAKYCLQLANLRKSAADQCSVAHKQYLAQISAGYSTKQHPSHQNQLLPFPNIETIRLFDPESFRQHNFKQTKYGDFVFKQCAEGFVYVAVQGYQNPRDKDAAAGYSVCFDKNHPLNASGPVERRQSLNHAKLYGFLKAINLIPKDLIPKLCVCVNDKSLIGFVSEGLPRFAENSFRTQSGQLNKDWETNMEINNLLRSRQDISTLRLEYVPDLVGGYSDIYIAKKMAIKAAMDAEKLRKKKRY